MARRISKKSKTKGPKIGLFDQDYKNYKWFFTSSKKLVVGGKSAAQNDELLSRIKSLDHEFIVMHTESPGSPFSVIISKPEEVSKSDLEETASFTGSFSRAWKLGKKKAVIHIFRAAQLHKVSGMNLGSWLVRGKVQKTTVDLKLALVVQNKTLRAVPLQTADKKSTLLTVIPGRKDKVSMLPELASRLKGKFNNEEILAALPAGGLEIL